MFSELYELVSHSDSLESTIQSLGYLGLFGVVFAECGLIFGVIFPGDSLLFVAGIIAGQGYFSYPILVCTLFVAAVLGNECGYYIGAQSGAWVLKKSTFRGKRIISEEREVAARHFYEKYGFKALVLARFIPVFRVVVPLVAGMAHMNRRMFTGANVIGAALWVVGLVSIGAFLGSRVPNIEMFVVPIAIVIVTISFLPLLFEILRAKCQPRHGKS